MAVRAETCAQCGSRLFWNNDGGHCAECSPRAAELVWVVHDENRMLRERVETLQTHHRAFLVLLRGILGENGCDCDCGHDVEGHDGDCERCLACRIELAAETLGEP